MKNWMTAFAVLALSACFACGTEDDVSTGDEEATLEVVDNTAEPAVGARVGALRVQRDWRALDGPEGLSRQRLHDVSAGLHAPLTRPAPDRGR